MAPATSVPELQQKLFKRMGLEAPQQKLSQGYGKGSGFPVSRKEQRKSQRAQNKAQRYSRNDLTHGSHVPGPTRPKIVQQKSIMKKRPGVLRRKQSSEEENPSEDEFDGNAPSEAHIDSSDGMEQENGEDDIVTQSWNGKPQSRAARDTLARDDAEIEDYERKLGIRKGRKSLPQAFKDDGLDNLMADLGTADQSSSDDEGKKRKRDYDDWLAAKRMKMGSEATSREVNGRGMGVDDDDDVDELEDNVSFDSSRPDAQENVCEDSDAMSEAGGDDGLDEESFGGYDSEVGVSQPQIRKRENPYVAPTDGSKVAKYVPPSLRRNLEGEGKGRERLRKQIQGQVNRLTDANLQSIVKAAEEIYRDNARGEVTEVLTEVILAQVSKPESLPDQFFVLTGGFCAAIYKIMGPSFGSHIIKEVVKHFTQEYDAVSNKLEDVSAIAIPKEASNLITFFTQLYVFEVISCKMIFDYMERLLIDLNEFNVELLLRVCRMAGRLLKKDDPQALKHVSVVLGKAVAKVGYDNVSARTKFMIETITDLKNSKPKAKGLDSTVVSEQVLRMKKHLGELKSRSRRLDGLAPMGISLDDVESADTMGKWWLVGASVPAKEEGRAKAVTPSGEQSAQSDDEDMDFVLPDYPTKARSQDLRTPTQIAIFTALLSASDSEQGYRQFLNLKLKKDEQLEIGRVLLQCAGSEAEYNDYYAMVGKQACSNGRIRFALQNRLWQIFRGLGESLFGEEADDEETADGERMKDERRVANVARFYASLIASGSLGISILKPLDLTDINPRTGELIEHLLISLLRESRSKRSINEDANVERIFGAARDIPTLAAGVHWFLRKRVRKSKLLGSKEAEKLERVRQKAQTAVKPIKE